LKSLLYKYYEDDREHQIKFSLAKHDDALIVQVEDGGIPFNPLHVKKHEAPTDLDSINIGGLGIHLIKNMVDDVNYKMSDGKNKVVLRKYVEVA
jgi:serine/threonine-protein kinase RsbW